MSIKLVYYLVIWESSQAHAGLSIGVLFGLLSLEDDKTFGFGTMGEIRQDSPSQWEGPEGAFGFRRETTGLENLGYQRTKRVDG